MSESISQLPKPASGLFAIRDQLAATSLHASIALLEPAPQHLRILLIEDQDGVGKVLTHKLDAIRAGFKEAEIILVPKLTAGLPYIYGFPPIDVAFIDLGLPDSGWRDTAQKCPAFDEQVAVIIVTGYPASDVLPLLGDSGIEIIEKMTMTLSGASAAIIEHIHRALSRRHRKQALATESRLGKITGILRDLRERDEAQNHGPLPTT